MSWRSDRMGTRRAFFRAFPSRTMCCAVCWAVCWAFTGCSGTSGGDDTYDAAVYPDAEVVDGAPAPPCQLPDQTVTLDTASANLLLASGAPGTDEAMVAYVTADGTDFRLFAAHFDGSQFQNPVEVLPPAGASVVGGAVSLCVTGSGRPMVAFDGADASGLRNYLAVGDGAGGFMEPVLVENEPTGPLEFGATYLGCSPFEDRGVTVTPLRTGTIWLSGWTGTGMVGPQQVVPVGFSSGGWYLSEFTPAHRATIVFFQADGAGQVDLQGLVFSNDAFTPPQQLHSEAADFPGTLFASASPHSDRALVAFSDAADGYRVVRVTGSDFGSVTEIDEPGIAKGRARVYFFAGVDRAAIVYETLSRDVRVVLDDGVELSPPETVGRTTDPMAGMHDFFIRFRSSPTSAEAFVLFGGDAQGGEAISLVPYDGTSFLLPLTVTSDPGYMVGFGQYAATGDAALLAFQTIDLEQDGSFTYVLRYADGQLGGVQQADCGILNHSMGDVSILKAATSDRFAVRMGLGGAGQEGTMIRWVDTAGAGLGIRYPLAEIVALGASDRFLVIVSDGNEIGYEVR